MHFSIFTFFTLCSSKFFCYRDVFLDNEDNYRNLCEEMASQFNQQDRLGLIRFNRFENWNPVEIDPTRTPEVVFLLANHNPRSTILRDIVHGEEIEGYANSDKFDLKFHVSQFSGYALHSDCMFSLEEFKKLV